MCVCVTGHRSVGYVQTMRWRSSNLGQQPLQNLGSVAYCYVNILDPPRPLFQPPNVLLGEATPSCLDKPSTNAHRVSAQYHPTNWPSPVSVPVYQCSWPLPYHFLSVLSFSDNPLLLLRLLDYRRRRTLAANKILSTVTFSWFSAVTCLHHFTCSFLPPS